MPATRAAGRGASETTTTSRGRTTRRRATSTDRSSGSIGSSFSNSCCTTRDTIGADRTRDGIVSKVDCAGFHAILDENRTVNKQWEHSE